MPFFLPPTKTAAKPNCGNCVFFEPGPPLAYVTGPGVRSDGKCKRPRVFDKWPRATLSTNWCDCHKRTKV